MLKVSIYRYNPDIDSAPYMQDFQLDTQGKDIMVLDVLEQLKAEDPTLVKAFVAPMVLTSTAKTAWPVSRHSQNASRTTP